MIFTLTFLSPQYKNVVSSFVLKLFEHYGLLVNADVGGL